jgi:SAM-dependent methyltransferase
MSVVDDFDRIARILESTPAREPLYLPHMLRNLPLRGGAALEVGCGSGELTRHLEARFSRVVALDLSAQMLRVARSRSESAAVAWLRADAADWPFPAGAFDCVVSLQTLHHLPLEATVARMRDSLRPGGILVLMDLVDRPGLRWWPMNLAAGLVSLLRRGDAGLRRAYAEHGRGERYLRPDEVSRRFADLLPGARIVHHLSWRYSVCWTAPG